MPLPPIHRHSAPPSRAFVNAYLVETPNGVIAIDATLTVSDGRALRADVESLDKPLLAVLLTHSHPDHYGGLTELVKGAELPIVATEGVDRIIRRDDDLKEQILRPMFGDEWPARRTFPNQTVRDGDSVRFDGVELTVVDLGPGESPHDSMWLLGGDPRHAFTGDQAYNHMHGYFADGFHEAWRANIDRLLRELPGDATLYLGHGEPAAPALLTWQRGYIEAFLEAVDGAEWSDPERAKQQAIKQVKAYLPGDRLQFLMELSVEPTAAQMGLLAEPAA